ncbi:hypothetical protein EV561_101748 [Rhizobium sp. BK376]|nr:hypothetical protein EV561_101748 [Rhizobium sp. BK376]
MPRGLLVTPTHTSGVGDRFRAPITDAEPQTTLMLINCFPAKIGLLIVYHVPVGEFHKLVVNFSDIVWRRRHRVKNERFSEIVTNFGNWPKGRKELKKFVFSKVCSFVANPSKYEPKG